MDSESKKNSEVNNCEDDIPQLEVRSPEKRVFTLPTEASTQNVASTTNPALAGMLMFDSDRTIYRFSVASVPFLSFNFV